MTIKQLIKEELNNRFKKWIKDKLKERLKLFQKKKTNYIVYDFFDLYYGSNFEGISDIYYCNGELIILKAWRNWFCENYSMNVLDFDNLIIEFIEEYLNVKVNNSDYL